jgi:hypothetical protein
MVEFHLHGQLKEMVHLYILLQSKILHTLLTIQVFILLNFRLPIQGTSSKTDTVFITNPSTVTVCTPTSFNPPNNYDATVNNVTFNTINNTTSLSTNGEYEDFSCTKSTIVNAGQTYQLSVSIRSNTNSQERFEAYIDYNNNGIFENRVSWYRQVQEP